MNIYKATALLSLALSISACITFKEERTYSKNGLTVSYRSVNRFGKEIGNYSIKHPIKVSTQLVKNHLLALYHRKIDPPGKAKPIFTISEIDDLSPLIVKAFKKVKSNRYLHFKFQSPKGFTEGDVFASVDKIHWRLLKINGIVYSNDPLRLRKPTWKLVRTRGQQFQKVQTAINQKSQKNWIIANLNLPELKHRTRHPTVSTSSSATKNKAADLELRKKLKTLQGLFDEGLIDENEYRKMKRKIMDQHL